MSVSRVDYFGETLIDISRDTVTADSLLSGVTAHGANGETITGTLSVKYFRSGTSEPSNSVGNNGDWYLVTEG